MPKPEPNPTGIEALLELLTSLGSGEHDEKLVKMACRKIVLDLTSIGNTMYMMLAAQAEHQWNPEVGQRFDSALLAQAYGRIIHAAIDLSLFACQVEHPDESPCAEHQQLNDMLHHAYHQVTELAAGIEMPSRKNPEDN